MLRWLLLASLLGARAGATAGHGALGVHAGPDVLFVLHDAGETFALNATARLLLARGVNVRVLPLGQPATDVVFCAGHYAGCSPLPATTLEELGVYGDIVDGTAGREQVLRDEEVQRVAETLSPRVVVSGMNYAMQLQLGAAMKSVGARFAAFFDGLRMLGSDSDIGVGLQRDVARTADEVWIASDVLWPQGWGNNFRVVGQPTLQQWQELSLQRATLAAARRRIYGAGVPDAAPALLWFGGYGPGYAAALTAWCRAAASLSQRWPAARFALSMHPGKHYGDLDRKVLQAEGAEELISIVPTEIPGNIAALASNLTVSQGSTGGVQSIFAGKPAVFLDPARAFDNAANLGVLLGLVPDADSQLAAEAAVVADADAGWVVDASKLAKAGVPGDPIKATTDATIALLGAWPPAQTHKLLRGT